MKASAVVACGCHCPAACGIFPDQGSNLCSLHWQADSQPLDSQGSPRTCIRGRSYSYTLEGHVLMEERSGRCNLRPRDAGNPQKLKEQGADSRPGPPGGWDCVLLTPWFQSSDTDSGLPPCRIMRECISVF